jgi:chemotaxis protein CheX
MTPVATDLESYRESAAQIVHDVFSTMLELETWPEGEPAARPAHPLVSAVYFAGAWKGAVLLECPIRQALQFTAHLMSIEPPDSLNDDVRDSMGELSNMIAGNLRSLLPPGTALSMPSVVEGSSFTLRVIGSNEAVSLCFTCPEGPFTLTLVQMAEP